MNDSDTLLFISTSSVKAGGVLNAVKILTGLTKNIELTGGNNFDTCLQDELLKIKKEQDINFLIQNLPWRIYIQTIWIQKLDILCILMKLLNF